VLPITHKQNLSDTLLFKKVQYELEKEFGDWVPIPEVFSTLFIELFVLLTTLFPDEIKRAAYPEEE